MCYNLRFLTTKIMMTTTVVIASITTIDIIVIKAITGGDMVLRESKRIEGGIEYQSSDVFYIRFIFHYQSQTMILDI